jgi:hypothetical protein
MPIIDVGLWGRCVAGTPEALEALYVRCGTLMCSLCRRD